MVNGNQPCTPCTKYLNLDSTNIHGSFNTSNKTILHLQNWTCLLHNYNKKVLGSNDVMNEGQILS